MAWRGMTWIISLPRFGPVCITTWRGRRQSRYAHVIGRAVSSQTGAASGPAILAWNKRANPRDVIAGKSFLRSVCFPAAPRVLHFPNRYIDESS